MDKIPQIILDDAKAHGIEDVVFGGEHEGIPYFVYEKQHKGRYVGLPFVAKIIDGSIEYVSDVAERFMALKFAKEAAK